MEIIIKGSPKEIADLALELQNRQKSNESKTNSEVFEKQMKLLSEASEFCVADVNLTQCLASLTHAMIELNPFCTQD